MSWIWRRRRSRRSRSASRNRLAWSCERCASDTACSHSDGSTDLFAQDLNRLIPREELVELEKKIKKAVSAAGRGFQMEILGSYRRGSAFCSDVDLVIRHERYATKDQTDEGKELLGKIVDQLVEHGLVKPEHQLARGASKFMGFIRLNAGSRFRRIDIRLVPHASYPYTVRFAHTTPSASTDDLVDLQLLGGSGDSLLMKFLRWKAKRMGWTLNEYGMGKKYSAVDANPNGFKVSVAAGSWTLQVALTLSYALQPGTLKEVKDEQEIFQLLKLPYVNTVFLRLRYPSDIRSPAAQAGRARLSDLEGEVSRSWCVSSLLRASVSRSPPTSV